LVAGLPRPPHSKLWSFIWLEPSLPKINDFYWVLVQGKLLTIENLKKRGIVGPCWCALCKSAAKSSQHIFFDCALSKQIWNQIYYLLVPHYNPPSTCNDMFICWKQRYVVKFTKKPLLASLWKVIPKFVCWEIWLTRNKTIFQNNILSPSKDLSTACSLLPETFYVKSRESISVSI
jgi:hypothetical protein